MLLADVAKFLADEDLVMSMERLPGGSFHVSLKGTRWPRSGQRDVHAQDVSAEVAFSRAKQTILEGS